MPHIAPITRNTSHWMRFRSAYFSRFSSRKFSGIHRSEFLSRHRQRDTRLRGYIQQIPPKSSFHHDFVSRAGRRRNFTQSSPLLDNIEPSSVAASASSSDDVLAAVETTHSRTDQSRNNFHSKDQDRALERFTHFALNPNMIPLGSMQEENWVDILDAIDAWLKIGGGFATDSADRLVERLLNEHAVSFVQKKAKASSFYFERLKMLVGLQRDVLNSWIDSFHLSEGSSQLALSRGEQVMFRFLKSAARVNKNAVSFSFPIDQYITIVEGYLQPHRYRLGAATAGKLLLTLISMESKEKDQLIAEHSVQISSQFENCYSQLLRSDPKSALTVEMMDTMKALKESEIFSEITIPDMNEEIELNPSVRMEEKVRISTSKRMSPFEAEIAETRLLELLRSGNKEEKNSIDDQVQKLMTITRSNDLVIALVDYYIRAEDNEKASHWLQQLEPSVLASSYDLVERVLESWLGQKSSRVAWRADEVFKAIAQKLRHFDKSFALTSKSFNLIVSIWKASEDQSSDKKIVDWYALMTSWMVKPDVQTLKITLNAVQSVNIDNSLDIFSSGVFDQWESFSNEDKDEVLNAMSELIASKQKDASTILDFLDRIPPENGVSAKSLYQSSLLAMQTNGARPSDVISLMDSFENTADDIDLSLYALAIDTLFKLGNGGTTPQIKSLYDRGVKLTSMKQGIVDSIDLSEFLYSVIAMHVNRKLFSEAEGCLKKAEKLFLTSTDKANAPSPISLSCYKKIIVRNWYTAKTAQKVQESFERLMKLYRSGYSDLQPDSELFTAYINARAAAGKDVEANLEDLIEQYKSNGSERMKPDANAFNAVLLSFAQNVGHASTLHTKSMNLLTRMTDLGVKPNIRTINLVLKYVIKGRYDDAYGTAVTLMNMMEENELNADSHTLHLTLDACGSASSSERDEAIGKCLSTFAEIRTNNFVGPITYGVLSKVIYRLVSRDPRADKVGGSVLSLCCRDGMLTPEVRGRLESLMSRSAWEKLYKSKLSDGEIEPSEWSRNIGPHK